jgi:predicted TIM-barrel fold metal-dependent hydrolase
VTDLPYRIVDADQHFYEPDDCFTRHLPKKFIDEGRSVHIVREPGEREGRVFIGDDKVTFYGRAPCDTTGRPGALLEYFKSLAAGNADTGKGMYHLGNVSADDIPESRNRELRLKWMNKENVEAAILLPSMEIGVEYPLSNDPEALGANLTAYNQFIEDDWGYGADGRLFGVPCLSLDNFEWAVNELERVIAKGAKLVHLRAGPVRGNKSPADPRFDPFWARCEEAGVNIAYHLCNTGEVAYYAALWGESPSRPQHRLTPFQRFTSFGDRAIGDTLGALITHNLFGRFPGLKVLSLEFGSEWAIPLCKKMDRAARMCNPDDWPFGNIKERPREVFKRHIRVSPFPEDDVLGLVRYFGADVVLGNSDWPHPEAVASPSEFMDHVEPGLSDEEVRLIMRDNTAKILGIAA